MPEIKTLFDSLSAKYTSEEQLLGVFNFLNHSLGEELKFKSLELGKRQLPETGELSALMKERQAITAISGIFKFAKARMVLIGNQIEALMTGKGG